MSETQGQKIAPAANAGVIWGGKMENPLKMTGILCIMRRDYWKRLKT